MKICIFFDQLGKCIDSCIIQKNLQYYRLNGHEIMNVLKGLNVVSRLFGKSRLRTNQSHFRRSTPTPGS